MKMVCDPVFVNSAALSPSNKKYVPPNSLPYPGTALANPANRMPAGSEEPVG
jgi:hypothetical protein